VRRARSSYGRRQTASSLIHLTDAGQAAVSSKYFDLQGADTSWNTFGSAFLAANTAALEDLGVVAHFEVTSRGLELRLAAGGTIGAVPLRSPSTYKVVGGVVVEPRFGWAGLGRTLEHVEWAAAPQILPLPLVPGTAKEIPPWVLAGPILKRLAELLHTVTRGFRVAKRVMEQPRGRIDWSAYCREQVLHGQLHRLPCVFPELGPDRELLSYVHWGLEEVLHSLRPYAETDPIARRLTAQGVSLIQQVSDFPAYQPTRSRLDQLLLKSGLPSEALREGLRALGWVVDKTGLAGRSQPDGLAWRLPMHELFENWVAALVRRWCSTRGGRMSRGAAGQISFPLQWEPPGSGSLRSLVPDVVVDAGETVVIVDAKYKAHYHELEEHRWHDWEEELKEEHRRDIHQVMAYCALFEARRIVAKLVYPLLQQTWQRLAETGRAVSRAVVPGYGRQVEVRLAGVPLAVESPITLDDIVDPWGPLH
jgi:hypothetical protein